MSFEYPEAITRANYLFNVPDHYVILIPLTIAASIAVKRQCRRYVIIFPKCLMLISSVVCAAIALHSSHLRSLRMPNWNQPLKIAECAYAPIYMLHTAAYFDAKRLYQNLLIVLPLAALLLGSGALVAYLMRYLYNDLEPLRVMMIAATLTTTQPDYLIRFLSQNDSYKRLIVCLQGECLFALLLTYPCVEYILHSAIAGTPSLNAMLWYFCVSHVVAMFLGWFVAKLNAAFLRHALLTIESSFAFTIGSLMAVYVACVIEGISGLTAGFVFCLILKSEANINLDTAEGQIGVVIRIVYDLIDGAVFFYSTSQAVVWCYRNQYIDKYLYCYALLMSARILTVIVANICIRKIERAPILHTYLHALVCPTSTFSLNFAAQFYFLTPELGAPALAHALINAAASIFINNFMGINFIKWSHLGYISKQRASNMEHTLRVLKAYRDEIVGQKKLDRTLAQVNWLVVNKYAKLVPDYPFPPPEKPINWEGKVMTEYQKQAPAAICCDVCPNVQSTGIQDAFVAQLSQQRTVMAQLMRSIVRRMTKQCLIESECRHILARVITLYANGRHPAPLQEFHDIQKTRHLPKMIRQLLNLLTYRKLKNPPRRPIFRLFYYIRTSIMYQILNYVITLALLLPWMLQLLFQNLTRNHAPIAYLCAFLFCLFDLFVDIFSLSSVSLTQGMRTYFHSFWHWMDFLSLFGVLALYLRSVFFDWRLDGWYLEITEYVMYLAGLRALRILNFISLILPKFVVWMEHGEEMNKIKGYQCALAMNECILEVLIYFKRWRKEVNGMIMTKLEELLYKSKEELEWMLVKLEGEMPLFTSSYKTRRTLLAAECFSNDYLVRLKLQGTINTNEYNYLKASISYNKAEMAMPPTNPTLLFMNNYWITSSTEAADFLRGRALLQKWPDKHILVEAGDRVKGVYLLVSGHLAISNRVGQPTNRKTIWYQEFENDFISPGNAFGEIELITCGKYKYTLICRGKCKMYFIDLPSFCEALKLSSDPVTGLDTTLWKRKMLSLAVQVLMNQGSYKYEDLWSIKTAIQTAFVPDLRCYKVFVYIDSIKDIVLLEGHVMDYLTKDIYKAPKYIPRTVKKLILPRPKLYRSSDEVCYVLSTKLMIIPFPDLDPGVILASVEAESIMVKHDFARCPYHVSMTKGKIEVRRAKINNSNFQINPELSASVVAKSWNH